MKPAHLTVDMVLTQADIHELFQEFDTLEHGRLSLAEIDKAIRDYYPEMYKHKNALMRAYRASDDSGDWFIEEEEFGKLLYFLAYYDALYIEFEAIDNDGDHRISFDELKQHADIIGFKGNEKQLQEEFKKMDQNSGGKVLFDEFCLYMASKKAQQHFSNAPTDKRNLMKSPTAGKSSTQDQKRSQLKSPETGKQQKRNIKNFDKEDDDRLDDFSTSTKQTKQISGLPKKLTIDMKLDQKAIHELFERFDATNNNGKLSLAEIDKAIRDYYPDMYKHKNALMRAYRSSDDSGDWFIEEEEFGKLLYFLAYYDALYIEFEAIDNDGDHRISFDELKQHADIIGFKGNEKQLQEEFKKMDQNSGGKVLFDEFCLYMAGKKASSNPKNQKNDQKEKPGKSSSNDLSIHMKLTPKQIHQLFQSFCENGEEKLSLETVEYEILKNFKAMQKYKKIISKAFMYADLSNEDNLIEESEFAFLLYFLAYYKELSEAFPDNKSQKLSAALFIKNGSKVLELGLDQETMEDVANSLLEEGEENISFESICNFCTRKKINESAKTSGKHFGWKIFKIFGSSHLKKEETKQESNDARLEQLKHLLPKFISFDYHPAPEKVHELFILAKQPQENLKSTTLKFIFEEIYPDYKKTKLVQLYLQCFGKQNLNEKEFEEFIYYAALFNAAVHNFDLDPRSEVTLDQFEQLMTETQFLPDSNPEEVYQKLKSERKIALSPLCFQIAKQKVSNQSLLKKPWFKQQQQQQPQQKESDYKPQSSATQKTAMSIQSHISEMRTQERRLSSAVNENQRLKTQIALLREQVQELGGTVDDSKIHRYSASLESYHQQNLMLQSKLKEEHDRYFKLQSELQSAREQLLSYQTEGKKEYMEELKRNKNNQMASLMKELKDVRIDKQEMERLHEEMGRKYNTEVEKRKALEKELNHIKSGLPDRFHRPDYYK